LPICACRKERIVNPRGYVEPNEEEVPMEIYNATDAISKALADSGGSRDVESVHQAIVDADLIPALLAEPKVALKAAGVKFSDDSQVQVTLKNRAHRDAQAQRLRRIIIIIIHWRNCDTDIIIFF
jgi:hypothetical protein